MAKLENYNGSVQLMAGITQKGGGDFALVDANAVQTKEDGTRLDAELSEINTKLEELASGGGGSTAEGVVDATPDTVALRDSDGILYGENPVGYYPDKPATDMSPTALINAETLERYAQRKLETSTALYGFDEQAEPKAYAFASDIFGGSNDIPTAGVVYEALSQMSEENANEYATKDELANDIGDISTALDEIKKIQEDLLDGDISVNTTVQEEFVLIRTIEVPEEDDNDNDNNDDNSIIDFTVESDGTPLNLKALYVDINVKQGSTGKINIVAGDTLTFSNIICFLSSGSGIMDSMASNQDILIRAMLRPVYGVWVAEGYYGAAISARSILTDNTKYSLQRVANTGNIKAIRIKIPGGAFAAGTEIKIYGVRAK